MNLIGELNCLHRAEFLAGFLTTHESDL